MKEFHTQLTSVLFVETAAAAHRLTHAIIDAVVLRAVSVSDYDEYDHVDRANSARLAFALAGVDNDVEVAVAGASYWGNVVGVVVAMGPATAFAIVAESLKNSTYQTRTQLWANPKRKKRWIGYSSLHSRMNRKRSEQTNVAS